MKLSLDGREFDVQVEEGTVVVDGQRFAVSLKGSGLTRTVIVGGRAMRVELSESGEEGARTANVDGQVWTVRASGGSSPILPAASDEQPASAAGAARSSARASRGAVAAQMTGRVLRIDVKAGDTVEEGALLLILEAMKMENEIRAPRAGTVKNVPVRVGDRVNTGDALVELDT